MHALSIDFGTSSVKVAIVVAGDDGALEIVQTATGTPVATTSSSIAA